CKATVTLGRHSRAEMEEALAAPVGLASNGRWWRHPLVSAVGLDTLIQQYETIEVEVLGAVVAAMLSVRPRQRGDPCRPRVRRLAREFNPAERRPRKPLG